MFLYNSLIQNSTFFKVQFSINFNCISILLLMTYRYFSYQCAFAGFYLKKINSVGPIGTYTIRCETYNFIGINILSGDVIDFQIVFIR